MPFTDNSRPAHQQKPLQDLKRRKANSFLPEKTVQTHLKLEDEEGYKTLVATAKKKQKCKKQKCRK